MRVTETIEHRGFSLIIVFDYQKGFAGSQTEPPEPAVIDIETILLFIPEKPWLEINITELLCEENYNEIIKSLFNKQKEESDAN